MTQTDLELQRECVELLDGIDVPDPFDLSAFVCRIGDRLGRPFRLAPFPAEIAGLLAGSDVTALLVPQEAYVAVAFRPDALEWSQELAVFHEIAHALCHDRSLEYYGEEAALQALFEQVAETVLSSHVTPGRVGQVLARHGYAHPQERKAEMIASLLASRVRRRSPPVDLPPLPPEDAAALNRLARALGSGHRAA